MADVKCNKEILKLLSEKSSTKQFVFRQSKELFKEFGDELGKIANELNSNICNIDQSVVVHHKDIGEFEKQIFFSGDAIVFQMHTNIFTFEKSHHIWKTSYIKEDPMRAYFGVIHMYNFLADSFKYNRESDYGQLLGRIYLNKDKHFFMEGQRQFAFLYNDLHNDVFNEEQMRMIIEKSIEYSLDFDLTVPNMNDYKELTLGQIVQFGSALSLTTRKKLGFKFSFEKGSKLV
jgi:hypothetical protein